MSDELPKSKPELAALRAQLIDDVQKASDTKTRMELQLKLSQVNAAIKHLNKVAAADAKHAADVRKALGRMEAEANTKRHEERVNGTAIVVTPTMEHAEQVLVKAKQLMREMSRHPLPRPAHFEPMMAPLQAFIDAQKLVCKGHQPKHAEDEWHETWAEHSK